MSSKSTPCTRSITGHEVSLPPRPMPRQPKRKPPPTSRPAPTRPRPSAGSNRLMQSPRSCPERGDCVVICPVRSLVSYRILITGSCGLVGSALRLALERQGVVVDGIDLRARGAEAGDVRQVERVRTAVGRCDGIVHLAAVSRVVWGERNPEACWATNVGGLQNVIESARRQPTAPWLIFASSREVYGQVRSLPATEDAPLLPMNIYGRSKVEGENLINTARDGGLPAAIIRLSNVYGRTSDHDDRVVPAFARAAVLGRPLRIDGADHTFDFTHIDDTVRGIVALVEHLMQRADPPPPIHFVTGVPTTLRQLAKMAVDIAETNSTLHHAPPRNFDVSSFYGSAERARLLLNWSAQVTLRSGLAQLIEDFRNELGTTRLETMAP
jgi:UDP-glucose 4-epimerase